MIPADPETLEAIGDRVLMGNECFGQLSVEGKTLSSEEHDAVGDGGGRAEQVPGAATDTRAVNEHATKAAQVDVFLGEVVGGES